MLDPDGIPKMNQRRHGLDIDSGLRRFQLRARIIVLVALAGLSLTATAAGSRDGAESLRFGFIPQRTFLGQPASLSVVVRPTGVRCTASIRYADRTLQRLPSTIARSGKASWRWQIPAKVKTGSATANVSCRGAGSSSRGFTVAGPPSAPAKVVLLKHGFSQRVVDTDTVDIDAIGAGTVFYLGGSTTIPDGSPVSKLEVVTRIGGQSARKKLGPSSADILVQAQLYDPAWTAAVVGQILNDHPTMLLKRTQVSAVIYDSAGNVIGGSTGGSYDALLPGVRAYFQASSGADAIPFDRVAGASVSMLGTYEPTS